jgi:predicted TIM-barrel fold metal-dependent hydrolase
MEKHPDLVLIGAHLGSMEYDLDALASRLDRHPNFHVDVSSRTSALQTLPSKDVRGFFTTYQDRILYGVDVGEFEPGKTPSPEQRIAFTEAMERGYRSDYRYYASGGRQSFGRREVECLELPAEVLEKFYHGNAERLMPTLQEWGTPILPQPQF